MCDSFTLSQEKLLQSRVRPLTADMQVQCEGGEGAAAGGGGGAVRDSDSTVILTAKEEAPRLDR